MLYLWLFHYKFTLICGGVVLMPNMVIKKKSNPIHVSWVGLNDGLDLIWFDLKKKKKNYYNGFG